VAMVTTNHIHRRYNSGVRARGDIFMVKIDSRFATPEATPTWTEAMACSRKPSSSHWTALQVLAKAGNQVWGAHVSPLRWVFVNFFS
jgi:hypothetical protein